jgi:hypothetical protein
MRYALCPLAYPLFCLMPTDMHLVEHFSMPYALCLIAYPLCLMPTDMHLVEHVSMLKPLGEAKTPPLFEDFNFPLIKPRKGETTVFYFYF